MLAQSPRCTETPAPRVTKPMISSPGTGVQHRASFDQTSVDALDDDAGVAAGVRLRRSGGRRAARASARSSAAPSSPPYVSISRRTTACALTCALADRGVQRR